MSNCPNCLTICSISTLFWQWQTRASRQDFVCLWGDLLTKEYFCSQKVTINEPKPQDCHYTISRPNARNDHTTLTITGGHTGRVLLEKDPTWTKILLFTGTRCRSQRRGIFHISRAIDGHFGHWTWPASKLIGLWRVINPPFLIGSKQSRLVDAKAIELTRS